jgi:hypothetical protein
LKDHPVWKSHSATYFIGGNWKVFRLFSSFLYFQNYNLGQMVLFTQAIIIPVSLFWDGEAPACLTIAKINVNWPEY